VFASQEEKATFVRMLEEHGLYSLKDFVRQFLVEHLVRAKISSL
jgi:hypothetical protein